MEILIAILIATAIAHGGTARGRDAIRDGIGSFRQARAALRGRGGPRARRQIVGEHLADRNGSTSPARILATNAWRGYRRGWTGETARQRSQAEGVEPTNQPDPPTVGGRNPVRRPIGAPSLDGGSDDDAEIESEVRAAIDYLEARHNTAPAGTDEHVASPNGTPPTSRGTRMTINTVTGGEILNYPQLLAELDAIVAEAKAETEDRHAARVRAVDDVARIELMLASLHRLQLDRETLAKLQAIGETNDMKVRLAAQAADNAEHRHALAADAKQTVMRKHQMLHEAHTSAGRDAAEKQFYQAG